MRLIPPSPVCDDAEFSADGLERLWLSRKVADTGPVGLIIGLNPSTAGATDDDHTIRKEKEFARRWGWSGFWKANLFTRIETDSTKLKKRWWVSFKSGGAGKARRSHRGARAGFEVGHAPTAQYPAAWSSIFTPSTRKRSKHLWSGAGTPSRSSKTRKSLPDLTPRATSKSSEISPYIRLGATC